MALHTAELFESKKIHLFLNLYIICHIQTPNVPIDVSINKLFQPFLKQTIDEVVDERRNKENRAF